MSQKLADGLVEGPDSAPRCWWHGGHADYVCYHDKEWGWPVADDRRLFEKICLEGFQAGLSWLTILRKRQNFRESFADFDFKAIARFGEEDVRRLLGNAGIIRHEGKIRSTINNAHRALELAHEFGSLAAYFWTFEPGPEERPRRITQKQLMEMGKTPTSARLSRDLKKRGWSFVGPTTIYAFMQAMGLVNDHLEGCVCRERVATARAAFSPPKPSSKVLAARP